MDDEPLFDADEVATRLKVTRRTVLDWAAEGKLTGVQLNKKLWRFSTADVQAFINRYRSHGDKEASA